MCRVYLAILLAVFAAGLGYVAREPMPIFADTRVERSVRLYRMPVATNVADEGTSVPEEGTIPESGKVAVREWIAPGPTPEPEPTYDDTPISFDDEYGPDDCDEENGCRVWLCHYGDGEDCGSHMLVALRGRAMHLTRHPRDYVDGWAADCRDYSTPDDEE